MTTAQVVETSATVNNNSPIQDYVHPADQTQPFEMTPGFKPFTVLKVFLFSIFLTNQLDFTKTMASESIAPLLRS